jgi:hypothetical protein
MFPPVGTLLFGTGEEDDGEKPYDEYVFFIRNV